MSQVWRVSSYTSKLLSTNMKVDPSDKATADILDLKNRHMHMQN